MKRFVRVHDEVRDPYSCQTCSAAFMIIRKVLTMVSNRFQRCGLSFEIYQLQVKPFEFPPAPFQILDSY